MLDLFLQSLKIDLFTELLSFMSFGVIFGLFFGLIFVIVALVVKSGLLFTK